MRWATWASALFLVVVTGLTVSRPLPRMPAAAPAALDASPAHPAAIGPSHPTDPVEVLLEDLAIAAEFEELFDSPSPAGLRTDRKVFHAPLQADSKRGPAPSVHAPGGLTPGTPRTSRGPPRLV